MSSGDPASRRAPPTAFPHRLMDQERPVPRRVARARVIGSPALWLDDPFEGEPRFQAEWRLDDLAWMVSFLGGPSWLPTRVSCGRRGLVPVLLARTGEPPAATASVTVGTSRPRGPGTRLRPSLFWKHCGVQVSGNPATGAAMDTEARYVAPRTCTAVDDSDPNPGAKKSSRPLGDYADAAAYVLIAEPGVGKTTAFMTEAASPAREYETVTGFRTFDDRPEWHDKTLFLDGLDESRAGVVDGRTPLDDIRRKLYRLGCPPFRLSCRWADWMAATDRRRLKEVSPDGTVIVLRLDPLSERNVKDILAHNHGVEDTAGFIKTARERGVERLLRNPQNLELLAKSVLRGRWPDSRKEMYQEACRWLVCERNPEHLAANPSNADIGPLIEAAGRLCAVQLLSGTAGYTLPDRAEPDDTYPSLAEVDGEAGGRMRQVLGTRLFVGRSEGKLAPTHRQIAEFWLRSMSPGFLMGASL